MTLLMGAAALILFFAAGGCTVAPPTAAKPITTLFESIIREGIGLDVNLRGASLFVTLDTGVDPWIGAADREGLNV